MAEDFVQVAPDSTGSKIRTRSRVIGANTVEEQYVIVQPEPNVISRTWVSTLRFPNTTNAAGAATLMFGIWNGIASGGNNVSIRRLSVEIDCTAAWTNPSPILRLYRTTTATTGGTAPTPVQQYLADPAMNASIVTRAAYSAEGTYGALAGGTLSGGPMWSQTCPRMATAVGFYAPTEYSLIPNDGSLMSQDPLILQPQQGVAVQLINPHSAALTAAWSFQFKAVIGEFNYP